MTKNVEWLFCLLRVGLDLRESTDIAEDNVIDWKELQSLASAQGVMAIAWDGLQKLITTGKLPDRLHPEKKLKLQWAYNVMKIEKQYAQQLSAIDKLGKFYSKHGIPMMVLKGYGLSLNYPVPSHRPCGDIDIWLYGKQPQADALLQSERRIEVDVDKHHHTVFYFDGVMVENHYDFLNVHSHISNREIEHCLQELAMLHGETIEIDGHTIYLPPVDFNALFLLRHAAAHFAAAKINLRHVIDWGMFVRRYHSQIDWTVLEQTAEQQNMHQFLHCMNALCIDYLGITADCFSPFQRDSELERKVLDDILYPKFNENVPKGPVGKVLWWKLRRWWANRWKREIVYKEGHATSFLIQLKSNIIGPNLWNIFT